MKTFETQTGFGYIRERASGRIVCRCDLPAGRHPIEDPFEFIELATREDLKSISVIPIIDDAAADRAAIEAKKDELAIAALRAEGYAFRAEQLRKQP